MKKSELLNVPIDILWCLIESKKDYNFYKCFKVMHGMSCCCCENIIDCNFCIGCYKCVSCTACNNLQGARFCMLNVELTEKEYYEKIKKINEYLANELGRKFNFLS